MLPSSCRLTLLVILSLLLNRGQARCIASGSSSEEHPIELKEQCQAPKASGQDPLDGCPRGTVFVSHTHPAAEYRTINAAVSALPEDGSTRTILIDSGEYNEKVVVSRVSPTILAGITSNVNDASANRVRIWQSSYVNQSDPSSKLHNCDAVVLGVGTGSAWASRDFKAYNIDFVQRQYLEHQLVTQYQLGPSAALCVQASNASFYGCSFDSHQDTIYVGSRAQAFFSRSIVRGMTDQLYGSGKAWFERATLLSRACGGGITAWRGDANSPDDDQVGVYISNSIIDRSADASTLKPLTDKCHLGRPWDAHAHAVYLNTWMGTIVAQAGFKVWSKSQPNFVQAVTRFAEYNSSGPGGDMVKRNMTLEHILTQHEAKQITYRGVFGGAPRWIDEKRVE